MAHARRAAGLPLTATDRHALDLYPTDLGLDDVAAITRELTS